MPDPREYSTLLPKVLDQALEAAMREEVRKLREYCGRYSMRTDDIILYRAATDAELAALAPPDFEDDQLPEPNDAER